MNAGKNCGLLLYFSNRTDLEEKQRNNFAASWGLVRHKGYYASAKYDISLFSLYGELIHNPVRSDFSDLCLWSIIIARNPRRGSQADHKVIRIRNPFIIRMNVFWSLRISLL